MSLENKINPSLSTLQLNTLPSLQQQSTTVQIIQSENQINENLERRQSSESQNTSSSFLTIEEALHKVGSNGRYQIICNIFFFIQWLIAGMVLNSPIFLFLKPTFQCSNGLYGTDCENWVCEQEDPLSYATYIPRSINMEFSPPLLCDRQIVADNMIAITYSGSILGLIISSYISDDKGRKITSIVFWVLAGFGSVFSGVAFQSVWLVATGLFITTAGVNPVITIIFCFISEHSGGQFREYSLSLLNVFFAIGAIVLALTQYISDDWKILQIYIIGTPLLSISVFYCYVFEPPIFLYEKNYTKTLHILNSIAKINQKEKITESELKNTQKKNNLDQKTESNKINNETSTAQGYGELFKKGTNLKNTICLSVILFIIQFHLYGTNLTLSSIGLDVKLNTIIIYIAETFSNLITVKIIPILSRRKNALLMIASNSIFILFFFVKLPSDCGDSCSEKVVQTVLMGLARFMLGFQINIHQVYISELYPTSIRSVGIGFTSIIGVIGSTIVSYYVTFFSTNNLNPIGSMGIAGLAVCVLYIPLKETHSKSTPKVILIPQKECQTLPPQVLSLPNLTDSDSEQVNLPTGEQVEIPIEEEPVQLN